MINILNEKNMYKGCIVNTFCLMYTKDGKSSIY